MAYAGKALRRPLASDLVSEYLSPLCFRLTMSLILDAFMNCRAAQEEAIGDSLAYKTTSVIGGGAARGILCHKSIISQNRGIDAPTIVLLNPSTQSIYTL